MSQSQTDDKVHSKRSELCFFCTKIKENCIIEAEKG